MEIRIGDYILKSDSFCYWIEKEYQGKDSRGRPKTQRKRVAGYASTLDNLIYQFVDTRYKDSDATTMKELIQMMKQTAEDTELIKKTAIKDGLAKVRKLSKEKNLK